MNWGAIVAIVLFILIGMAIMAQGIFVFALIRAWDHIQQSKIDNKEWEERNRRHDSILRQRAEVLGLTMAEVDEQCRQEDMVGSNPE